jgi:dihydroflavonol-4-reductase
MNKNVVFGSVLVTGATGIVGWSIVQALHAKGLEVRVLARNLERTRAAVPPGVDVLAGDLGNPDSLQRAVAGCDTVFHAAGMSEQWLRDPGQFHRVNVEGTRALVGAALREGIGAFIYTSTIDVFAHQPGVRYNESMLETEPLSTPYERSKQLADQVVAEAVSLGLPARFIHPAAVFGPSPTRTPGLNDVVAKLAANRLPVLPPGGVPIVFAPDVARGHIAAAATQVGSRYILCERYVSFGELAEAVKSVAGSRRPPQLSARLARGASRAAEAVSRVSHRAPILPAGQLHFMTAHHQPDSARAAAELDWVPTPLELGLAATLRHQTPPSVDGRVNARQGEPQ